MSPDLQPQSTLPALYEQYVSEKKLHGDDAQRTIVEKLENLRKVLANYTPPPPRNAILTRVFGDKPVTNSPRSIYIWGDVGRGKSLLMDMFYNHVPVARKRRVHFHALMLEIHEATHSFRQKQINENPVEYVAAQMAKEYQLFCLDEFQVTDVADAMILHKLFQTQLNRGVTFVITSNRPPEELYKGGLQRDKFMAFVELVQERMDVLNLDSIHDYRMQQLKAMQTVYFTPRNEQADKALRQAFRHLTHEGQSVPRELEVMQGRKLPVFESYGSVALFTFHELCEKPLGAADYLAIAKNFHVVLLSGIPRLSAEKRNEAKRFVTLIDTLYDHHVKFICSAEASPEQLYAEGDGAFEFQRTVSRLAEMQSAGYLASQHLA